MLKDFLDKNWPYAVLVAALTLFALVWSYFKPEPAPVSVAVHATPAPEIAKTPKVETPVAFKSMPTYPKAAKRKLDLPEHIQADDNKQVVEASKVPADDHTQTVTTLVDIQTGKTETYVRRDPLPLLALDYSGDAGLYVGLRNGAQVLRFEARQGFFTVKAIHFGALGSIEQPINNGQLPPSTFIGGGAWGNWK